MGVLKHFQARNLLTGYEYGDSKCQFLQKKLFCKIILLGQMILNHFHAEEATGYQIQSNTEFEKCRKC